MKIASLNRMNCGSSQLEKNSQKRVCLYFFFFVEDQQPYEKTWHEKKQLMLHFAVEMFPEARGNWVWMMFSNTKFTLKELSSQKWS